MLRLLVIRLCIATIYIQYFFLILSLAHQNWNKFFSSSFYYFLFCCHLLFGIKVAAIPEMMSFFTFSQRSIRRDTSWMKKRAQQQRQRVKKNPFIATSFILFGWINEYLFQWMRMRYTNRYKITTFLFLLFYLFFLFKRNTSKSKYSLLYFCCFIFTSFMLMSFFSFATAFA